MDQKFVKILQCPKTGADLALEPSEFYEDGTVKSGVLRCEGGAYPVIDGIPRFVSAEIYSSSFGYEWKKWSRVQFESDNIGTAMEGHTRRMFDACTGLKGAALGGKMAVEFGCGPGRFLDIVREKGGIAVGLDMSGAVEPARANFQNDRDVLIIQGDILHPPLKKEVFDLAYSIGVLHHTPDPKAGFLKMAETVKAGGEVVCCVYPKEGLYDFPSVRFFRATHNLIAPVLGKKPALAYSQFSARFLHPLTMLLRRAPILGNRLCDFIEKYLLVILHIPDSRWRVLDTFDAITPVYASTHTTEEIMKWFRDAGCADVSLADWGPTSLKGRRT